MATARAHERAADRRRMIVLPLSALGAGMLDTYGKAANLGELIGAGSRCPTGSSSPPTPTGRSLVPVDDLIGRCHGPELAARARGALLAAEVPADVAVAIRDGYAGLGEGQLRGPAGHLSSRDRGGPGRVVDAVRPCWASLWTDRAVAYRAATGIYHRHVRLAVVVQRMVDAVAAGVLFTANPVTGRRRQTVIDASPRPGGGGGLWRGQSGPVHR